MEEKLIIPGMISIIVPVYNTNKLLMKCVNSLLNQTYRNFEIIIIDDGSDDLQTARMCDELALANPDIIFVFHKKNEGQGVARNLGINKSRGEYIAFVDSDDWISNRMYEILINNMWMHRADISCCNNGCDRSKDTNEKKEFLQPDIMFEHLMDHHGTGHSPCDKLYKKALFKNVRFAPLRAYEDCATLFEVFSRAEKVVYQDVTLYHYVVRENSTMTQKFSDKKFQAIEAYYRMYKFYKKNYPQYLNIVAKKLVGSILYCIGECYREKQQSEYKIQIKNTRLIAEGIDKSLLSIKHRLLLWMISKWERMYGNLYRIIK